MERKFYVYVWYRKSDNTPFYVGKGMEKRYSCLHNRNKYFHNTLKKHGGYSVKIKENLTEDEALDLEKELIKEYRKVFKLTNLVDGGLKGTTGLIHNEITRSIISKKSKEQWKDPIKRARLIEARRKSHSTPEVRRKISEGSKGKILTEEHKKKISEGIKRSRTIEKIIRSNTKYKNVKVFDLEGNLINSFENTTLAIEWAEKELGKKVRMSSVIGAISGKNKTSFGYRWSAERLES